MYEKRMGKLELADREIPITDKVRLYGPESADITLVGWGINKGCPARCNEYVEQGGLQG